MPPILPGGGDDLAAADGSPVLWTVDPVAVARSWLISRPAVMAVLGDGENSIGPDNEPPYPYVRLTDMPGNDRNLRHLIGPLVQVEVIGDLDGTPDKPTLRAILYLVLGELAVLPEQPSAPGAPVVTNVVSTGAGGWSPLPTGQPRYLATVQMFMHPPHPDHAPA